MAYSVRTAVQMADRSPFERVSGAFRNPQKLMRQIGVLGLSSATKRVQEQVAQTDGVSTGRLMGSLSAGGPDNIFDASRSQVTIGTNLRYAAQRQFGGTIYPKDGDALAIPLHPFLKRQGLWPREIDPNRELLQFRPTKGTGKPNVFGVLINPAAEDQGPTQFAAGKGKRKRKPKGNVSFLPTGPLFALAYLVRQEPRPFLYWSDADRETINSELVPDWLSGR